MDDASKKQYWAFMAEYIRMHNEADKQWLKKVRDSGGPGVELLMGSQGWWSSDDKLDKFVEARDAGWVSQEDFESAMGVQPQTS